MDSMIGKDMVTISRPSGMVPILFSAAICLHPRFIDIIIAEK